MRAVRVGFALFVATLQSVCGARVIVGSGPRTDPLHETVYADVDGDGLPDLQAFAVEGGAGYSIAIGRVEPAQDSTFQLTDPLTAGGDEVSASAMTIAPAKAPIPLRTNPVIVLTRNGITEKLTNMLAHSRRRRRKV